LRRADPPHVASLGPIAADDARCAPPAPARRATSSRPANSPS